MTETASHQAGSGKGGRSRFSKALPAPPPIATSPSPEVSGLPPPHLPSTPRKQLPATSTSSSSATLSASSVPLPPLLPDKNAAMAIPRRPVGAGQVSSAQTSPVTSISSILSTFSSKSSAPSQRSSTTISTIDGASPKGSDSFEPRVLQVNPVEEKPVAAVARQVPKPADANTPPPPLPLRDPARISKATSSPLSPLSPLSPAPRPGPRKGSSLMDTLMGTPSQDPPPSQIWRCRSLKSDKELDVTELQLQDSNGSTSDATTVTTEQTLSPKDVLESKPLPVPRDSVSSPPAFPKTAGPAGALAFPGRNIRPAALPTRAHDTAQNTVAVCQAQSPVSRLPTPDYGKDDVQSPLVEDAWSPHSPAASPKLPSEARLAQTKPVFDAKPAIPRKPVGVIGSEHALRTVKSIPDLAAEASNVPAAPSVPVARAGSSLPIPMPRCPVGLPGSPSQRAPPAAKARPQASRSPVRNSSRTAEDNARSSAAGQPEQLAHGGLQVPGQCEAIGTVHSEPIKPVSEVGSPASVDTMKPDHCQQQSPPHTSAQQNFSASVTSMGELQPGNEAWARSDSPEEPTTTTDNPGAALFPRNWYKSTTDDGVLIAASLKKKHFDCFQKHRTMFPSSQEYNPISCATCGKKDTKPVTRYWSCGGCYVRVCGACRDELHQSFRGNLRAFVDDLESRTLMNLYRAIPGEDVYHAVHEESGAMGMDDGPVAVQAAELVGPA